MDPDDVYGDIEEEEDEEEEEEEEDEDEEMDEEDEYADMPPLVGLNNCDFKACDSTNYELKGAKPPCCYYNSPQQTKPTPSNPPQIKRVKNEVIDLTEDAPAMCTRSKRSQVCKNLSEGSYFN
jgi:hypothetical protein